ncbi:MAG: transglutaminase domain-containing protein [Gemmatimonadetes bacterium]|nr:transglutaminase domain-containing protein [Gemmatimonadota bacterium]
MNRRLLAIEILVAWVRALGWLGAREFSRRGRTVVAGRQAVSPGAAYYRIRLDTAQVGYALLQVETLAPTDTSPALVLVQSRVAYAAGVAPQQGAYTVVSNAWLTTDLRLWRSETLRGDPDGVVQWRLRVDHDTLRTTFVSGDSQWTTSLRLDTVPVPVEAVPLWLATYARPRPGRAASVAAIDLSSLVRRRETWTATAESTLTVPDSVKRLGPGVFQIVTYDTVHAWRVSGTDRSVQVHQWVDENGFPFRWWTGGGLRFERDAFEPTLTAFRAVSDSLTGRSVLAPPAPADHADLRSPVRDDRRLLLAGAEYPPLEAAGPTQRISGDTVETFEPESWRGMQAYRPLAPLPIVDPRFTAELWPEPRLSPEDTALTALAQSVSGGTQNARDAALAIQNWLVQNIADLPSGSGPSVRPAGVILAARQGTPEEKATLLVALARRLGLPARTAGGLLLTARGARAHTWAEVFIGDWVPLDPGQPGRSASPAHIRLVTGGSGRWTDLFPLAGGLVATGRAPIEIR